ncbi:MAG TPA: metallophosphoesterase [Myxococcota bacterium]|nr:metallophosphoesterase [Myxococcota bacterium]
MLSFPDDVVPALALVVASVMPVYAFAERSRTYAVFAAVLLALTLPGACIAWARLAAWLAPWHVALDLVFAWGIAALGVHLAHLVRARMRGRIFRALVSVPAQVFCAAGVLSGVWLLAFWPLRALLAATGQRAWLEALRPLDAVPFAVAALSLATSLRAAPEWVRIALAEPAPPRFARVRVERHRRPPPPQLEPSLRLVQIADPHLGPWLSVARLRRQLERLLAHDPHLVMLTGDFLTMESRGSPGALAESLAPLRAFAGRSFAIFGNHDLEAEDEVRAALEANGVELLEDAEVAVDSPVGPLQILGARYVWRDRRAHLEELCRRHPRRDGSLRLLLLHDPQAFHHLPPGCVDLTLSGHTHGGQLGLLSLGLDWTVLRHSAWPDHGLFSRGAERLYVHRGTGFYGFPLRIGVPGEHSVLELVAPRRAQS